MTVYLLTDDANNTIEGVYASRQAAQEEADRLNSLSTPDSYFIVEDYDVIEITT